MKIGLDFDNTIACYESVFPKVAKDLGLVANTWKGTKVELRDWLESKTGGDLEWQKLQGLVYGRYMYQAEMFPGVANFLLRCKRMNVKVHIVSHKTEYGHFDINKVPLRKEALKWMKSKGFFLDEKFNISPDNVFFASTREEKVDKISKLNLNVFVDDLIEVYCEPNFPIDTKKILFGTAEKNSYDVDCVNWSEINLEVLGNSNLEDYHYCAQQISDKKISEIFELQGRGNSRVHRIITDDGTTFALKSYPDRLLDPRNRIEGEFNACSYLEHTGLVPKAIGLDLDLNMAIYEWIEGKPVNRIEHKHIVGALSFIKLLWNNSQDLESSHFPLASEACLSVEEILSQIKSRYLNLKKSSKHFENLKDFLETIFVPVWDTSIDWVGNHFPFEKINKEISKEERTLSPSDFGFHNILMRNDGSLCFIDLEYFGFDDPAKLIADFIWSPGNSLSISQKKFWVKESLNIFGNTDKLKARLIASWPIYGLRWSLIILNEFLQEGWKKRVHAKQNLAESRDKKLEKQLFKAKSICDFILENEMKCPYV